MRDYLQHLPGPEAGAMPRTSDTLGATVELAALRASYPHLRYRIVAIDEADDTVVAGIAIDRGGAAIPGWIDGARPPGAESPGPVAVRIADRSIVDHAGNIGALPSYLGMVLPDSRFRMETAGRLTVAELHVAQSETAKQLPLPGPGVFVVQSGSITVIGDGLAELVVLDTSERISIPAGVERVANPGDAIIVPLGDMTVRIDGGTEATLLAALMVPVEPERDRYFEREPFNLLDLLRELPEGVQPIWFGTAEVLSGQPAVTEAGWVSLEAGWLVVPPGEQLGVKNQGWNMALHSEAGDLVIDALSRGETTIMNMGSESALVLVARVAEGDGSR
jgi:hypothetical protein